MSDSELTDRAEVRALLTLDQMPGIGLVKLRALVDAFGSAERALRASKAAFGAIAGGGVKRRRPDPGVRHDVDAALAEADRLGMEVCTWRSADYPEELLHLADPPPVLFLRGRRELLTRRAVTIVGARHATGRSRELAERLGHDLARAGMCVISGMALGVDGSAHRGALAAGGDTLAVLGRGADAPYPATHRRLFREIMDRGLVVSEFLPGTPPLPHHFPRRNRILAALSQAVVVVEAGSRSGALITVDHALDLGIDVWAVPGPIEVATCAGSNRLLAEGARPLVSVAGFVQELTGCERSERVVETVADGPEGRLLSELAAETLNVDQLALRTGLPVAEALALLTAMELRGAVRQMPGMRFRRAA